MDYALAMELFSQISVGELEGENLEIVRGLEERLKVIAMLDGQEKEIGRKMRESG